MEILLSFCFYFRAQVLRYAYFTLNKEDNLILDITYNIVAINCHSPNSLFFLYLYFNEAKKKKNGHVTRKQETSLSQRLPCGGKPKFTVSPLTVTNH